MRTSERARSWDSLNLRLCSCQLSWWVRLNSLRHFFTESLKTNTLNQLKTLIDNKGKKTTKENLNRSWAINKLAQERDQIGHIVGHFVRIRVDKCTDSQNSAMFPRQIALIDEHFASLAVFRFDIYAGQVFEAVLRKRKRIKQNQLV